MLMIPWGVSRTNKGGFLGEWVFGRESVALGGEVVSAAWAFL